jgi:hypothetical protein
MHPEMSQTTRKEILTKMQVHYGRAGLEYRSKLIDQVVELFGYHRKAAIRALGRPAPVGLLAPFVIGRPKEYDPEKLLVVLKPIWLAALQPCGKRLVAALPAWVPAYEQDHRRLDGDVRRSLLSANEVEPVRGRCCGRRYRFARSGLERAPATWRSIR